MNNKLKEILDAIRSNNNTLFAESAFQYYIDNQITDNELIELLKEDGYKLPDDFISFSKRKKRTYLNHIQTRIYFENGEERYYWYEVFNKPYFYDLAKHARKNKELTNKMISYLKEVGNDSVPLMFLGMQYVKLKNTTLSRYQTLNDYAEGNGINDVYEMLVTLYTESEIKKGIVQLKNLLKEQLIKKTLFEFDLNLPFVEFSLYIECALHLLPRKEANTLKVKFHILQPEQLRDIDYYSDIEHQTRIINTFKKKMTNNRVMSKISGFVISNQDTFDNFSPNGYSAIYYYLMEEGL